MRVKRVAVLPVISSQYTVWKESGFIIFWKFAREWKDVTVYFVINKDAEIPAEYNLPNIVYVRVQDWFPFNVNSSVVSSELYSLFNSINGQYQVDVLFTSRTIVGANLARLFTVTPEIRLPVVLHEIWVPKPKDNVNSSEAKLKSIAYSECPTFFMTNREEQFAEELAKRYMTPTCLRSIYQNAVVMPNGINAREIAERASSYKKYDKFTLYFAARLNANKQWQKIFEIYETVCKMNDDVQVKVVALGEKVSDDVRKRFSKIEFLDPLPYWEYVELLYRSHLSLSMSVDEGFATGWLEQVLTGNPVIFPAKDWSRELIGVDYPFRYKNVDEIFALIKWIKQNYPKAREQVQSFAQRVIDKYDIGVTAEKYLQALSDQIAGSYVEFDDWVPKFLKVVGELPDEFSFEQFIAKAEEMYKATFGTYVILIGAYRNIYMVLRNHTDLILGKPNHFRKRV